MATPVRTTFAAVPPDAAEVLRPGLPAVADEIIAAIAEDVPDYARAMSGAFGKQVRLGVEIALGRFIDAVADPVADLRRARETYVNLGRGEFHAGRSLDALLAAYRVGARVAWRRFVEAGTAGGLEPDAIYSLGEAIFAYIDEISAESADGYAEEQSAAAGESQRRRRRLVRLLAEDPPAAEEAIRTAARAAAWPLPRRVAAIVAAEGAAATPAATGEPVPGEELIEDIALRLARRLGGGAIGGAAAGLACVFVPDPDAPGRRRQLEAAAAAGAGDAPAGPAAGNEQTPVAEGPLVLGPTVGWAETARSLRRAAAAFRLGGGEGLVVTDDHLVSLLLRADPELAADLAATRLAPLAELADGPRARLTETLRAWIDRPGQVQAVAADLGVHPQTVRYRLRQLRELFGTRLEDPDARFELALALRVV